MASRKKSKSKTVSGGFRRVGKPGGSKGKAPKASSKKQARSSDS